MAALWLSPHALGKKPHLVSRLLEAGPPSDSPPPFRNPTELGTMFALAPSGKLRAKCVQRWPTPDDEESTHEECD